MSSNPAILRKQDADPVFHGVTRSMCPQCLRLIDAEIHLRDNRVIMRKRCPTHGRFEALISSDAEGYVGSLKYNKPGTIPPEFATQVTPLPRIINVDDYLDYITNRTWPDPSEEVKHALETMWSSSAVPGSDNLAAQFICASCDADLAIHGADLAKRIFAVSVKDFMDPYTFDVGKLMKCCVAVIAPDGRMIPFCAYNNVGYREEIREAMKLERARQRLTPAGSVGSRPRSSSGRK